LSVQGAHALRLRDRVWRTFGPFYFSFSTAIKRRCVPKQVEGRWRFIRRHRFPISRLSSPSSESHDGCKLSTSRRLSFWGFGSGQLNVYWLATRKAKSKFQMRHLHDLNLWRSERPGLQVRMVSVLAFAISIACMGPHTARAQVAASGDQGGLRLSAGAMGSGFSFQYGQRKMAGITGFIDADTRRRLGVEVEERWLEFNQTASLHAETYSATSTSHTNTLTGAPRWSRREADWTSIGRAESLSAPPTSSIRTGPSSPSAT
jgi:hypothetical protein